MYREQATIRTYYEQIWETLERRITMESEERLIGIPVDDLVEEYFSDNHLNPIEFNPLREMSSVPNRELRRIPAHLRHPVYQAEGDTEHVFKSIVVNIPIIPNKNLQLIAELETTTMVISSWSKDLLKLHNDFISFEIDFEGYYLQHTDEQVVSLVKNYESGTRNWIERKNQEILGCNDILKNRIKTGIEKRKQEIEKDRARFNALSQKLEIPLKKNEVVNKIQLDASPLVKQIKPNPRLPVQYILDKSKVLDIISFIKSLGKQFEKTPLTFKDFQEEDLRNVILLILNSIFEGKATGETFANKGKTDIYLCVDEGNILKFECKIWGGKKQYQDAIDQLLTYLTWDNNFGVIISFIRQKNMSKILEGVSEIVIQHPTFKGNVNKISDNHYSSHHKLNQDEFKNVEIHHLFFNLFTT